MLHKHDGLNTYSSNRLLAHVDIKGPVYLKADYELLGSIDRLFVAAIDKNTKKCVFVRDLDINSASFEKKVVLGDQISVDLFLNIKSKNKVWVDISSFGIVENGEERSLIEEKESISIKHSFSESSSVEPGIKAQKKKIVSKHSVESGKIYKYTCQSILKSHKKIMLEGFDGDGNRILRRSVESQKTYKTIFQTSSGVKEFVVKVNDEVDLNLVVDEVTAIGESFKPVEPLPFDGVVACMATYPARRHIFLDSINTIIKQVDRLYVYLNNYDEVPEEILEHDYSDKIEYILDPSSRLRASAKFSWLSSVNCNVITIDDDILYPSDYVEKLLACSKRYGGNAVIGVHGSIFKKYVKDASKCRESVFNFQNELSKDTEVHMLGSGTTLFPASVLRYIDAELLLKHPLANDELLAINMRNESISMIALRRDNDWMIGHPDMDYGIFEEKQLNGKIKSEVSKIVSKHNPWPKISDLEILK